MDILTLLDFAVMPNSICRLSKENYECLTSASPNIGDNVIIAYPADELQSQFSLSPFMPIAITGTVREDPREDAVMIVTGNRISFDYSEIEDDEGNTTLEFDPEPKEDIADITKEELKQSGERIKYMLLGLADSHREWFERMVQIIDTRESPETVLSAPPLNSLDVAACYGIVAEGSLKNRAGMVERYIADAVESGLLKKAIDTLYAPSAGTASGGAGLTGYALLEEKINASGMSAEAAREVGQAMNRLKNTQEGTDEYGRLYDFINYAAGLPYKKSEYRKPDLAKARIILDNEHYGMKKVKERIIRALAVMVLNKKQSGAILCLVGAPGVGKTSVCRSVAKALGRKYARVSLGGVHDEADIRGHRRTYIGAMPGRIIDAISKCGTTDPVIVLDEVDKLGVSNHGDPGAALLELLDPEQNSTFTDHYLNFPYDMSDVMFICTANSLDTIPEPLLSRMEVVSFDSYTQTEKCHIASKHLLPAAVKKAGLPKEHLTIPEETMKALISGYTMEGGVRGLKKQLDTICGQAAVKLVMGEKDSITLDASQLAEFLDCQPIRTEKALKESVPGVVTGLAWTQNGGRIMYIETRLIPGGGKIITTGQLGDVMRESAQVAVSLVKSLFPDKAELFGQNDLHIHVPEGAVPKDGPSAGIALTTAIASLITGKTVDTRTAMTGEISLRGAVTAIGGLSEKLWGAKTAGISTVLIPKENIKDLEDTPEEIKDGLDIITVSDISDVLRHTGLAAM